MEKRILFLLASEKGKAVLAKLLSSNKKEAIGGVMSFHEVGVDKDWFEDIREMCEQNNVIFFPWINKTKLSEIILNNCYTGIIAIGWKYMIPLSLNQYLDDRIIIFHDSLLPKYRGFAPVVTAMLCGDQEIGATALFASDQVDCGDIICQKKMIIAKDEYIKSVISRMAEIYADMAIEILDKIVKEDLISIPQDDRKASYSIWRDEEDYWIKWDDSAEKILRSIRALGSPYKGARARYNGETIRILKAFLVDYDLSFCIRDCGKIWRIIDGKPIVVCGKGLICLEEARAENGKEVEFLRVRMRMGGAGRQNSDPIGRYAA